METLLKKPRNRVCHQCSVCGKVYVRRDYLIVHLSKIDHCGKGDDSIKKLISMKANVALLDMFNKYNTQPCIEVPILLRLYISNLNFEAHVNSLEQEIIALKNEMQIQE